MPLLNFQSRFAPLIASGEKNQTIRAYRKDGRDPKPGDPLYLWTGCRTKDARKIGETICSSVTHVVITRHGIGFRGESGEFEVLMIDGPLDQEGVPLCEFEAMSDGFSCFEEMVDWFEKTHGLPFNGLLIKWAQLSVPGGTCCSCGYDGQEETECPKRADRTHCVHWWDGE